MRIRSPDQLDPDPLGPPEVERTRVFSLLFSGDHDPGPSHAALQAGPFADTEREVIDAARPLILPDVPETEDLVAQEEERMVRALPDDVHPELFHKEPLRLRSVLYLEVDVVEPHQSELARGGLGRHGEARHLLRYIGSVRARGMRPRPSSARRMRSADSAGVSSTVDKTISGESGGSYGSSTPVNSLTSPRRARA